MDELTLLEDFRAAVAPPDERILARARSRMLAADVADPADERTPAGRPRRRLRWPQLALSGVAVAAIAVTLSVVLPGGPDGTFVTKAWAVERNPDGTVTVTLNQQVDDPAGLQRALRSDGVTAFVQVNATSSGSQGNGAGCTYLHLSRAPEAVQKAVITGRPVAAEQSWTIHPSAMPPGSSILFADWVGSVFSLLMHPAVLTTDTTPTCTPASAQ